MGRRLWCGVSQAFNFKRLTAFSLFLIGSCAAPERAAIVGERIGTTSQAYTPCLSGTCPDGNPPYRPSACTDDAVYDAINKAAVKYGFPRWWLYAIINRESSFDRCNQNPNDYGKGLIQLTNTGDFGWKYPDCQSTNDGTDSNYQHWIDDKGLDSNHWPGWLKLADVTPLNQPFNDSSATCTWNSNHAFDPPSTCPTWSTGDVWDPVANLDRFMTGYAAPGYSAGWNGPQDGSGPNLNCGTGTQAAADCAADNLRSLYYHYGYGIFQQNPGYVRKADGQFSSDDPRGVLNQGNGTSYYDYDWYVDGLSGGPGFRSIIEAQDGRWYGPPCTPPYTADGCSSGGGGGGGGGTDPTYTATATPTPSCHVADGGTVSIATTFTNTNNVAYTGMLDVEVWDGTTATKVAQGYSSQTVSANGSGSYTFNWTVPASQTDASKTYTIKLGVFSSGWTANPYWNDNAGSITIRNASTGCGTGPGTPTYTSSATPTPSCRVADGGSVSIAASFTNTNNTSYTGNLDAEVWDGGDKVGQGWAANQTIAGNGNGSLTWSWNVPTSLGVASKTYAIKLGVFSSDWTANPYWNNSAGTITVSGDNAKYNFECSSVQNWTFNSGGMTTGVASSTTQASAGTNSLAASFNGSNAGGEDIYTRNSPMPTTAGTVVTYHVWIPAGTNLTAVQPYVKEGASNNFRFTGNWKAVATLNTNAWNAITVTVPTDATFPLFEMGVEYYTLGTVNTTTYIDAVTW